MKSAVLVALSLLSLTASAFADDLRWVPYASGKETSSYGCFAPPRPDWGSNPFSRYQAILGAEEVLIAPIEEEALALRTPDGELSYFHAWKGDTYSWPKGDKPYLFLTPASDGFTLKFQQSLGCLYSLPLHRID
ncbi:MAG: hypothetical protein NDJ90_07595 [Oligoflexia bacterium]|nr:hypothetical protein [Oligoflexia bacterium]